MSSVRLSLIEPDLREEDVHELTADLCRTLNHETDINAAIPEGAAAAGAKGDPITLGTLALSFISGGSAVALIKVLEVYFSRRRSLEVHLERPDGAKLTLKAENAEPGEIDKTARLARKFLGG